ncbi:MAG: hypothetical protein AB7K86_14585 [Rhodospirillales bacterium]
MLTNALPLGDLANLGGGFHPGKDDDGWDAKDKRGDHDGGKHGDKGDDCDPHGKDEHHGKDRDDDHGGKHAGKDDWKDKDDDHHGKGRDDDWKDKDDDHHGKGRDDDHHGKGDDHGHDGHDGHDGQHAGNDCNDEPDCPPPCGEDDGCDLQAALTAMPDVDSVVDFAIGHLDSGGYDCVDVCDTGHDCMVS